jgi:hypothetical membrane protein
MLAWRPYTHEMSTNSAEVSPARRDPAPADSALRVESQAVYVAIAAGVLGAVVGLLFTRWHSQSALAGPGSFGLFAAYASAVVAAGVSAVGYWRSRNRPGQEWRLSLAPWTAVVNTLSVVIVHTALAFLGTYVVFLVLSLGLVGLPVGSFFGTVIMGVTLGMTAYLVFPSVASMNTRRMSGLLMTFIVLGTLTSAVTTSDPAWWTVHFSQLGTFNDLSSWIFNGTLIAGGLLVTTFAVYISHDMNALVSQGRLSDRSSARTVSGLFVVMGVMLAGVGLAPVDVSFLLHTLSASGMAIMFLVLLTGGRRYLSGMPQTYFVASWIFLATLIVSIVLFLTTYFSLAAFEIIVFALVFGWIEVFIRFLGLAGDDL